MFEKISQPLIKGAEEKVIMAETLAKHHKIDVYTIEVHLWQDGDNQVELFYNEDGYRISILIK